MCAESTPGTTPPTDPYGSTVKGKSGGTRRGTSSAAPPEVTDALPSAHFGKFVRTQKLGAGGMGEVWKAQS